MTAKTAVLDLFLQCFPGSIQCMSFCVPRAAVISNVSAIMSSRSWLVFPSVFSNNSLYMECTPCLVCSTLTTNHCLHHFQQSVDSFSSFLVCFHLHCQSSFFLHACHLQCLPLHSTVSLFPPPLHHSLILLLHHFLQLHQIHLQILQSNITNETFEQFEVHTFENPPNCHSASSEARKYPISLQIVLPPFSTSGSATSMN